LKKSISGRCHSASLHPGAVKGIILLRAKLLQKFTSARFYGMLEADHYLEGWEDTMFHIVLIVAGVFIAMVIGFRLVTHFHFCGRVSEKNPGEEIKGCPVWTQKGNKNRQKDGS